MIGRAGTERGASELGASEHEKLGGDWGRAVPTPGGMDWGRGAPAPGEAPWGRAVPTPMRKGGQAFSAERLAGFMPGTEHEAFQFEAEI